MGKDQSYMTFILSNSFKTKQKSSTHLRPIRPICDPSVPNSQINTAVAKKSELRDDSVEHDAMHGIKGLSKDSIHEYADQNTEHITDQVTQQVSSKSTVQDKVLISSFENKLIAVLDGEKSRVELMKILNITNRKSFMSNCLEPSVASGYIKMTIPENPQSVKQKYYLTYLGEKLKSEITGHDTDQVTQQVPSKSTVQDKVLISTVQNRLITILDGEKSRAELMKILNLRDRKSFMNQYIEPAIASGFIEMTIQDNPKNINQKYRLTKKGKNLKKEIE